MSSSATAPPGPINALVLAPGVVGPIPDAGFTTAHVAIATMTNLVIEATA